MLNFRDSEKIIWLPVNFVILFTTVLTSQMTVVFDCYYDSETYLLLMLYTAVAP